MPFGKFSGSMENPAADIVVFYDDHLIFLVLVQVGYEYALLEVKPFKCGGVDYSAFLLFGLHIGRGQQENIAAAVCFAAGPCFLTVFVQDAEGVVLADRKNRILAFI